MKVLLATACGAKKNKGKMPAIDLYKSSRIKAVYNRKNGADFAVLSAKYGLMPPEKIIKDYEQILDSKGIKKLMPQVIEFIRKYEIIVFFKGGSREEYRELIKTASETINKPLILIGNRNQEDIGKLEDLLIKCTKGDLCNINEIAESIETFNIP
ncbi:MAG: hypothetical protein APG12_00448 [Candidatus Methanofastidiosum methylothiophilum]|uniref:DUF6884 domain-containing protein n=1 Tax=Candidatus Methanofastidiosum methylothiophilum TaxID=1705564 RepID=A0A150J1C8_9EURY|nr:MAG: hypothetical protein APG10_00397 [Candidatus Methanofastidiosum methylthiophilus]KYC48228.1 MAG: hypothetical protein APG11_00467 [Candidatus Methanofastidiosum methylthiophilus]KYC50885.1 MAG: hypothetical protein APG12_00448 [Candidatus Methanofastidiosum methylthiophilus]